VLKEVGNAMNIFCCSIRSDSGLTEMTPSHLTQCSPVHRRSSQSTLQSCCNDSNGKTVHYTAARPAAVIQVTRRSRTQHQYRPGTSFWISNL